MKKSVLFILAAFAILACACSKYGSNPLDGDQAVILTPSSRVITLDPSLDATEALSFTWTPGSNQKTGAGIGYTFEMCVKGDNFQHPYRYELGRTTYRYFSFISAIEDSKGKAISLYAILEGWQSNLDIPAAIRPVIGKPCAIQARIIAKVYSSDIEPVASEAVEVEIGRHFSISVPFYYSSLDWFKNTIKFRMSGLQPEVRYWFRRDFTGFFAGAHATFGWYNVAVGGRYRYQDHGGNSPVFGGGINGGYRLMLGNHSRWALEFSLGAGYLPFYYDTFFNVENGALAESGLRNHYWGLDHAAVTLSFRFGKRRGTHE